MRPARTRPAAGLVLVLVLALVAATACSGDEGGDAAPAAAAAGAFAATAAGDTDPAPVLEPGQSAHRVGTSFQHQSFIVTVGWAVHDPRAQELRLGLRFANISGGWAQTDASADLELPDGSSTYLAGDLVDVPPGVAVDVTAVASSVPDDPVPDGVVRWGSDSYDQPVFRLDGSGGENLWLPADVAVDGWAQIGKFGVHLTGIQVNASQVEMGIQADPGTRILRVLVEEYTAKGTTSPFTADGNLLLELPSGELLDAVDGSPMASQLSWTSEGGQWADFVVPADLDGRYQLLLASMPKLGFGTLRPELIERRGIPFELADVEPGPPPQGEPLVVPRDDPSGAEATGTPFDLEVDVGSMNIPGADLRPTRLAFDPETQTATLDVTVSSLTVVSDPDDDGLLSAPPSFGFRVVLADGGRLHTGLLDGDATLDPDAPTDLRFEFTGVTELDPDATGLYVGPSEGAVSSTPIGARSPVVAWPPTPVARVVEAPEITAGDWTVQLRAFRLGLVEPDLRPAVGRRQLELSLDVTASTASEQRALGLSFRPQYQVLLASGTGYDQAAIADSGLVELEPGGSVGLTVTFDVADTFQGGRVGIVVRSRSEYGELLDSWVETRFEADLTTVETGDGGF